MSKAQVGEEYLCVAAETPFYKVNQKYVIVEKAGKLGTLGSDGLFDEFGYTVSRFKKVVKSKPKKEETQPQEEKEKDAE